MDTIEFKKRLQTMYPNARRIKVRQYPLTYKGSMRGYTIVDITGGGYDFHTVKDKVLSLVPDPKHTFVDVMNI